jgi:hypothetical protein
MSLDYEQIVIYKVGTLAKTAELSTRHNIKHVKKLLLNGYDCAYGQEYRAKVANRRSKADAKSTPVNLVSNRP